MNTYTRMLRELQTGATLERLRTLYGDREGMLQYQLSRYSKLVKKHMERYNSEKPLYLVSAPGRIEIIGNHTDHQNGRVMAAAVNLDMIAAVSPRDDRKVSMQSKGYPMLEMTLDELSPREEEKGTTAALIRGIAAGMAQAGWPIGGFDAVVESDVPGGSGLSSSAAMEVLIAAMLESMYPGAAPLDPVFRAQIAQRAENEFFGKPSGLMDQMAISIGGVTAIDFKNEQPAVEPLRLSFAEAGYAIIVVNTRGAHDQLTGEYAAIRTEMNAVAHFFGEDTLRRVRAEQVTAQVGELRQQLGDRPVLRAMHFVFEEERVRRQTENVRRQDLDAFMKEENNSGESSWMLLQNVYMPGASQPISLALALAQGLLAGRGAARVHGGGFAGTTLNFVPQDLVRTFIDTMEKCFGADCCYMLDIRPEGPALVCHQPS